MPIESHLTENGIDIKDLTLEQPKKEDDLDFDPHLFLTKEAVDKRVEACKSDLLRDADDERYFAAIAEISKLKLMFPERFPEFGINENQQIIKLKDLMSIRAHDYDWYNCAKPVGIIKILYPERLRDLVFRASEGDIKVADFKGGATGDIESIVADLAKGTAKAQESGNSKLLSTIKYFNFAFPDAWKSEFASKEQPWKFILGEWEKQSKLPADEYAANIVASAKILFPEKFDEIKIRSGYFTGLKNQLKEKENNDVSNTELALNLQIIGSEKLEIDDNGVRIIPKVKKPNLNQRISNIPETKKF